MIAEFSTDVQVEEALRKLKSHWNDLLRKYRIKVVMRNSITGQHHRPYQCMVTFNMSHSASYFESGIGRVWVSGFNQTCWVSSIKYRAEPPHLDIASTQFEDGSAYINTALTKKGNNAVAQAL